MEDKWKERGGRAYIGKVYVRGYHSEMKREDFVANVQGSEILSMGIQRLLEDPVRFRQQDPDYFNFIKSQLSRI